MKRAAKNGWILLLAVAVIAVSAHAQGGRSDSIDELNFRLQELEKERLMAESEHEDLELRLASEDDPAWMEITLRKELGLVPEGWVKVVLSK